METSPFPLPTKNQANHQGLMTRTANDDGPPDGDDPGDDDSNPKADRPGPPSGEADEDEEAVDESRRRERMA